MSEIRWIVINFKNMKIGILSLSIAYILICCAACQKQAASDLPEVSKANQRTEIIENSLPTQTPEKEIYVEKVVEDIEFLEFDGYKIRQFVLTKKIDDELPEADI